MQRGSTQLNFQQRWNATDHAESPVNPQDGSIPPRATKMNQPLTVRRLVGTHEVFFPNLDTVVPKNVVCGRNVKEKLWCAIFQSVVFNS